MNGFQPEKEKDKDLNKYKPPGYNPFPPMPNFKFLFLVFIISFVFAVAVWGHASITKLNETIEIPYEELIEKIDNGVIDTVEVEDYVFSTEKRHASNYLPATSSVATYADQNAGKIKTIWDYIVYHNQDVKIMKYRTRIDNIPNVEELIESLKNKPNVRLSIYKRRETVSIFMSFYLLFVVFYYLYNAKKERGVPDKSTEGYISPKDKDYAEKRVLFSDVAGEDEAKESLQELVDFLHNPKKYSKIGAKLPKGALMVGSPGSGKTLLGKAIAGEANVPFFYRSASEFVEIFVGVGAKKIRELFAQAKKCAPCVIFIDEIDAIGGARGGYAGMGDSERDQTLNQLLTEMDGFGTNAGIIVIGATNRPEILDKALLRPGRFDRRIIVDKPDLKGRVDILKVHTRKVKLRKDVDLEALGLATAGLVGADLANLVNEACLLAVKNNKTEVSQDDLMKSIELVLVGKEKKNRILNEEEKRTVAIHETGHACATMFYAKKLNKELVEPVAKISIIPTVQAGTLGYVLQTPTEERSLESKSDLETRIITLLGGRAAEELLLGKDNVTGGCANDIEKASTIIKLMITQFGMSDLLGLYSITRNESQYLNNDRKTTCSDSLLYEVDKLCIKLLNHYYKITKKLLKDNWETVKHIAHVLYTNETITGKQFLTLYEEELRGMGISSLKEKTIYG